MLSIFVTQAIEPALSNEKHHSFVDFVRVAALKDRYWLLDTLEAAPLDATVYKIDQSIYQTWVMEQHIRLQKTSKESSVTKLAIALGLGEGVLWFLLKTLLPASGLIFAVSIGTALFDYVLKWSNTTTDKQEFAELGVLITFDMIGDLLGSEVSALVTTNPLFIDVLAPALGASMTFAIANSLLKLIKTEERTLLDYHKKHDDSPVEITGTTATDQDGIACDKEVLLKRPVKHSGISKTESTCVGQFFAHENTGLFIADFASGVATAVVSDKVYSWLSTLMPKPAAMLLTAIIAGITTSVTFGSLYGPNRQLAKSVNRKSSATLFHANTKYGATGHYVPSSSV